MAGLGFKDFQVGEVLTSADVDGYLMQQTVMRFADAGARGSALGTAAGTGVPLAEGMVTYLDDIDDVQVYDGTGWSSVVGIRQVVDTTKTDTFSTTSTSFTDVTGLSVTITPVLSTSRIMVIGTIRSTKFTTNYALQGRLLRDSTAIGIGDAAGSRIRSTTATWNAANTGVESESFCIVDSPATTSAVTYKWQVRSPDGGAGYINRDNTDTDSSNFARTASFLVAMEVAV